MADSQHVRHMLCLSGTPSHVQDDLLYESLTVYEVSCTAQQAQQALACSVKAHRHSIAPSLGNQRPHIAGSRSCTMLPCCACRVV